MSGLEFTEETARQLERIVRTRDVVAQRSETLKQLTLCPGERVLDLGCGPQPAQDFLVEAEQSRDGFLPVAPQP